MQWSDVRAAYPEQWLIVEALEAYTTEDHQRHLARISVVEQCPDGNSAFRRYRQLHESYPERELYFVHTSRPELTILERQWLGIRKPYGTATER